MFHAELDSISAAVVEMTTMVSATLERATEALLEADVSLAESVISSGPAIEDAYEALEDKAIDLLARQSPVAGDLRIIVAGLRGVSDLERMGGLARHIAKIARLRYPQCAVPELMRETIQEMSSAALSIARKAAEVVESRDTKRALELEVDDDRIDTLRRSLFETMLSPDWAYGVEPAIDMALVGRYYERFADHAVEVARLVIYMVTGEKARLLLAETRAATK
ncbi:MAG TPA: phosphate signaling complex protein PhoU [Mycobacteriales bacterium]|nr:phosphate signaling complex protein PhoU [Mycobacteriales bacterium]